MYIGKNRVHLDQIESTNNEVKRLFKEGKIESGTLLTTSFQTTGKGQMGSIWESAPKLNFLGTYLIQPKIDLQEVFVLNMISSLAVKETVADFLNQDVEIKWPNDIVVEGKKISGVLVETKIKEGNLKSAFLGIGLNINQLKFSIFEREATSLKKEKGSKSIDVDCKNLETIMNELNWGDVDIIKADIEGMWWEFCNELLDKNIKFRYLVMEWELIFDELSVVLEKAKILCDKFSQKGYNVYLNKVRGKMMLELIFIRKDVEEFINKPLHTY